MWTISAGTLLPLKLFAKSWQRKFWKEQPRYGRNMPSHRLCSKCFSLQHDVSLAKQLREAQTPSPIVGRGVTVLVVGGGAREHAIVCHLLSSKSVGSVLVAPGNAGTAQEEPGRCRNVDVSPSDTVGLVALAIAQRVALVIVGPEQPLVDGIVDAVHAQVRRILSVFDLVAITCSASPL